MDPQEVRRMGEIEDQLWWFKTLRNLVVSQLTQNVTQPLRILDAGCGTGGMLHVLSKQFPNADLYGIDLSPEACEIAATKSSANIHQGTVESLPYPDNHFDVVVCLDVLEYDVSPAQVLSEIQRVLSANGILILNVPAFSWMYSYHDIAVGQIRRFNRKDLNDLLKQTTLKLNFQSYWNTILFPLMVFKRKMMKQSSHSDVEPIPNWINSALLTLLTIESFFLNRKIPLPFGGSLITTLRKNHYD